jgi:hypothetical protein
VTQCEPSNTADTASHNAGRRNKTACEATVEAGI